MLDRITSGYIGLLKQIEQMRDYDFYNQVQRTNSNKYQLGKIKDECDKLKQDVDNSFNFYLYNEDKWYQLDIYSKEGYEGSIRDSNLSQLKDKLRGIYLKALILLGYK